MLGRCGTFAAGETTMGDDHVLPPSALRLTTVPSVCSVSARLHARYTRLRSGSAAMDGASSYPYCHDAGAMRRPSLHGPETPARVETTRYGVMSSLHGDDARYASTSVAPANAIRGACSTHDPIGSFGGAASFQVRPPSIDV